MAIVIRRMEDGDLKEVFKMWSSLYKEHEPCGTMTLERLQTSSKIWLNIYVAEIEGEIAGFINFVRPGFHNLPLEDSIYVGELFVKPEYRRRGVGKALVKKVIQLGRENRDKWKATRIVTNAENKAFWENLGFTPMNDSGSQWSHEYLIS